MAASAFEGDFGRIFGRGGVLGTAILRPGGQKQSSRLVPDSNNMIIKLWTKGLGLKWPGGFVWAAGLASPFYNVVNAKLGERVCKGERLMRA